jgi:hypothetical protein
MWIWVQGHGGKLYSWSDLTNSMTYLTDLGDFSFNTRKTIMSKLINQDSLQFLINRRYCRSKFTYSKWQIQFKQS